MVMSPSITETITSGYGGPLEFKVRVTKDWSEGELPRNKVNGQQMLFAARPDRPGEVYLKDPEEKGANSESILGAYVVDGRPKDERSRAGKSKDVIIITPQWSDGTSGNPVSQGRAEMLAEKTNSLVIYVGNPGVDVDKARMPDEIRRGLGRGDFGPVSKMQWQAIEQVLTSKGLDPTNIGTMFGSSQGSYTVASLLEHAPNGTKIEKIHLWETAMLPRRTVLGHVANYLYHALSGYREAVKNNPDGAGKFEEDKGFFNFLSQFYKRPAGMFYYPWAASRLGADILFSLIEAKRKGVINEDTVITVGHGAESGVSRERSNKRLAGMLGSIGLNAVYYMAEIDKSNPADGEQTANLSPKRKQSGVYHASIENAGFWHMLIDATSQLAAIAMKRRIDEKRNNS